jgi:hypothetical protein
MDSITPTHSTFEELDYRASNGIEVWLLWSRDTDRLSVVVSDGASDETIALVVSADEALDAFNHPYAYAAFRGALDAESDPALA